MNKDVFKLPMKALILQMLLLPVLAWLLWSADIWMAFSLDYPAYFIAALFSFALILLPCLLSQKPATKLMPAAWLLFIVALPFVSNSSLKPLIRGLGELRPGMDRGTVLATLTNSYANTTFPLPVINQDETSRNVAGRESCRLCIKPQGRDPGLQAENLLVFLTDGQFDHAVFSPD